MIISRTPYRVSFFGGGTDYPAWYRLHGGAVLAATLNKYCYLSCRYLPPFFEHRIRIVYSKMEHCQDIDEISHPAARETLRYLNMDRGLEIHHDGDLPARSGMGTSSSFTVGFLHALYGLRGQMPSKRMLANEAIHIEQEILKETVGSQDQVAVAYGGLNHIAFSQTGEITVWPLTFPRERIDELNDHLMLFYTGIRRTASGVAESYVRNIGEKEQQLRMMAEMVHEGVGILSGRDGITRFGKLLHEAWLAKRSLGGKVSNSDVEEIYREAMLAGAIGGKLTGAGGGGFMLLFVPPAKKKRVRERLNRLLHVQFRFEFHGSQIIFFEPEEDYSAQEKDRLRRSLTAFRELGS
ncbi:MAG: kinase [Acidobacteria bacterium]|nr:kinase [Acidobacteriota bacterium]